MYSANRPVPKRHCCVQQTDSEPAVNIARSSALVGKALYNARTKRRRSGSLPDLPTALLMADKPKQNKEMATPMFKGRAPLQSKLYNHGGRENTSSTPMVETFKQKIKFLESERSELKKDYEVASEKLDQLEMQNQELKKDMSNKAVSISELNKTVSRLRDDLQNTVHYDLYQEVQKKLADSTEAMSRMQNENLKSIEEYQHEIEEKISSNDQLRKEVEAQQKLIQDMKLKTAVSAHLERENHTLRTDIDNIRSQLSQERVVTQNLKLAAKDSRDELELMQEELANLRCETAQLPELKKDLSRKTLSISELNETVAKLQNELKNSVSCDLFQELEEQLANSNETMSKKQDEYMKSIEDYRLEIEEKLNTIDLLKEEIDSQEKLIQEMKSKLVALTQLEAQNQHFRTEVDNLQSELSQTKVVIQNLQTAAKESKDEHELMHEEMTNLRSENVQLQELKNELSSKAVTMSELDDTVAKLRSENVQLQELKAELSNKVVTISELDDMVAKLRSENVQLQELKTELSSKVVTMSELNDTVSKLRQELQNTVHSCDEAQKKLADSAEEMSTKQDEFAKSIEIYKTEIDEKTSNNDILKKEIESHQALVQEMKQEIVQLEDENQSLSTEINQARSQLSQEKIVIQNLETTVEETRADYETLQDALSSLRCENDQLLIEKEHNQAEFMDGMSKLTTSIGLISELKTKVRSQEQDLGYLRQELNEKQYRIEQLEEENAVSVMDQVDELRKELQVTEESFQLERKHKERYMREMRELEYQIKELKSKASTNAGNHTYVCPTVNINSGNEEAAAKFIRSMSSSFAKPNDSNMSLCSNQGFKPPAGIGRTFLMEDEAGEFMNLSDISSNNRDAARHEDDTLSRINMLQQRNAATLPHLRSSYAAEYQELPINESAIKCTDTKKVLMEVGNRESYRVTETRTREVTASNLRQAYAGGTYVKGPPGRAVRIGSPSKKTIFRKMKWTPTKSRPSELP
ncbi:Laminin-like protein epi-1 [Halotydeus destructor]|nr:Laminin-like protein epi-1 [Halotydeus destructor]